MKKPVVAGIVFALLVIGYIVYSSMNLAQHRVEVCMTYNGLSSCSTVSAATVEEARRTATDHSCAEIASGVTDTIGCGNTQPTSVKVLK